MKHDNATPRIAVMGLGYVGMPLACMFASRYNVVGYDVNPARVASLSKGVDTNDDLVSSVLDKALENGIKFTSSLGDLADCNVYIISVPTPVNADNSPDMEPLRAVSESVGKVIGKGDTVVYESTVYPGTTEEFCIPIIEEVSGLRFNVDFFAGYSPERINPGDVAHPVWLIPKITSGSTEAVAEFVDSLYSSVLQVDTHRAPCIKVAEAAKILENTQRDVNIAFVNECAKIFEALGIDTHDVIDAASTKWNFMRIYPGLVGGHCISVDPYYLIHKARAHGVEPSLIAGARAINDTMPSYIVDRVTAMLARRGILINDAKVLLLGFTFKENVRDTRNTKVVDLYRQLASQARQVEVYDSHVDAEKAVARYGVPVVTEFSDLSVVADPGSGKYDLILFCVNHDDFAGLDLPSILTPDGVIFDIKSALPRHIPHARL